MPLVDEPPSYHAYLLRFWEERSPAQQGATWRFSLEQPHTGERRGFSDLETLVDWLRAGMADNAGQPQGGLP